VTWKVEFAPKLSIVRSGKNVIISWPSDVVGYTLQQKTGSFGGTWGDIASTLNSVTLPANAIVQYFRLIKP
jgi:hypothetical protein